MGVRKPIMAGQFYPAQADVCRRECRRYVEVKPVEIPLPQVVVGGMVPHAGWVFSGDCIGLFFSLLQARCPELECFIVLGAAHRYHGLHPAVGPESEWVTPLGGLMVDRNLLSLGLQAGAFEQYEYTHEGEHSIEVILPFIKYCYPDASIVPVLVPPHASALTCGGLLSPLTDSRKVAFLASTDLTHYGPGYGFMPYGNGMEGWIWARDINDQRFLDCVVELDGKGVLEYARENASACGAGAVAAAVTLAQGWGVTKGYIVAHTTSNDVMLAKTGSSGEDSVGYATVIF